MERPVLTFVLSIITGLLLFAPFYLPEEWIYIKHAKSIIHPFAETLMSVSLVIIGLFAGHGIVSFFEKILND